MSCQKILLAHIREEIQQCFWFGGSLKTPVSVSVWASVYCLDFFTRYCWIIPFVEPHHHPAFIIYSPSQFSILCYLDLCVSTFFLLLFFPHDQTKWEYSIFFSALGQKIPLVGSTALVFTPECVAFSCFFFLILPFYWIWIKACVAYTHLACFLKLYFSSAGKHV